MSKKKIDIEAKQKLAGQVARAHDLLVYGTFQGSLAKDVLESRDFLTKLHEEMIKEIEQAEKKASGKASAKSEEKTNEQK